MPTGKTNHPKLACSFFRTPSGVEPVRVWLKGLNPGPRKEIGADILAVQIRWPVSKPLVDGLGGGLYEVRTKFERNEFRVLFIVQDDTMVLLHGFQKKTQKTPQGELALARQRQKEAEQ